MKLLWFSIVIFSLFRHDAAELNLNLVYEKDVSEHCRRRVVPSIFLGRQVIDANAKIMQFSRLELPYSCYISVRTESGSSMVMMMHVKTSDVQRPCQDSGQLLVYEMGETFGGYWGPIPETAMKRQPLLATMYTLKTTHAPMPTTTSPTEEEVEEETKSSQSTSATSVRSSEPSTGDYVEVEIPLLNVSARYLPIKPIEVAAPDITDTFDLSDEMLPIKGTDYHSSVLPLVQFRLVEKFDALRTDVEQPKYDVDIAQDFTPDLRLTWPQLNLGNKRTHKPQYQRTKRLKFKKHRTLFHSQRLNERRMLAEAITRKINYVTPYTFPTRNNTKYEAKNTQDSWRVIEDLLKKLSKTKEGYMKTTLSVREAKLLERLSEFDGNKSAYLSSNLSLFDNYINVQKSISTKKEVHSTRKAGSLAAKRTETLVTSKTHGSNTSSSKSITLETTSTEVNDPTTDLNTTLEPAHGNISNETVLSTEGIQTQESRTYMATTVPTLQFNNKTHSSTASYSYRMLERTNETQSRIKETTTYNNSTSNENDLNKKQIVTGSMVGHESWENLVQAAPEMAVFLNQTVADINRSDSIAKDITPPHKNFIRRKKRDIHSIAIENAKPHNVTTKRARTTTTQQSFDVADMQEFAQLVELQDDELHGRVALRHLNQFVGPPLFNLCDLSDPTVPHVHLFNSSRIVLAPTNFSLDRVVIILTAARALLSGELRCPKSKIECQVSGARVCLDSMVACDGVPNCGSYDIYDEDRLLCGNTASLQHNVYLAAFTCLAVLLTIIYAVHYWLKRCVPKVADAFFVYSDGVENILYLDTIMRSPHDMTEDPKMVYHSHLFGDDYYEEVVTEPRKSACRRFLETCCFCCRKSQHKQEESESSGMNLNLSMSKRIYSFTELEIQKMLSSFKDTAVQTGDSLEMRPLQNVKDRKIVPPTGKQTIKPATTSYNLSSKVTDSILTLEAPLPENHTDELALLKFLKADRAERRSTEFPSQSLETAVTKSPPEKKISEKLEKNDSPSEREIESHTYDRYGPSEPGPSKRKVNHTLSTGSVNKHLRFDDVTTTILDDTNEDDQNITRRTVTLGEKTRRSISRALDTIDEADEQSSGAKEHRNFWGVKGKKSKKKKSHVSLR